MNSSSQKTFLESKRKQVFAAFLIIGDEILSGRTRDENLHFLANNLTEIGINLREVRVVADSHQAIIKAINELRSNYDYVFTSGGIGPTHDDITSKAVAAAFGVELKKNQKAEEILFQFYGKENVNEARLKMAYIPASAELLDNPVSSAPGFKIGNVFVMAGVPKIFQAMFVCSKKNLVCGAKTFSKEIKIMLTESIIAKDLTELQALYPQVAIGSYPFESGTALVFRSINQDLLDESVLKMKKIISNLENSK